MTVKIYTTTYCPYCKMAKDFFKKNNVKYEEINVENDEKAAEEMTKKSGQMGVPVIDIDGKIIVGFDRPALEKALKSMVKAS
ncbi:MAG: thioredoxin family protein [Candidatus Aenigmarchaeota archaeon]|nr:thioredoxin family protein [Candidatus Aenigmarchaeota archaeon]